MLFHCLVCHSPFDTDTSLQMHLKMSTVCGFFRNQHMDSVAPLLSHMDDKLRLKPAETVSMIPTIPELFQLIKSVQAKNQELEKRIRQLETKDHTFLRKNIPSYLQQNIKPTISFMDWIKSIPVTRQHLLFVLYDRKCSLIDGIKKVFLDFLQSSTEEERTFFPIRCYTDKPHTIFIYEALDGSVHYKWQICHLDTWFQIMNDFHDAFRSQFYHYEIENRELFERNFQAKERLWNSMIRINSAMTEKHKTDIKSWIYQSLKQSLGGNQES